MKKSNSPAPVPQVQEVVRVEQKEDPRALALRWLVNHPWALLVILPFVALYSFIRFVKWWQATHPNDEIQAEFSAEMHVTEGKED